MTFKAQTDFLLIFAVVFLSACAPATPAVPSAGPTAFATRYAASATSILMPKPGPTAASQLSDHEPYFAFISEGEGNLMLTLIGPFAEGLSS